jgi:hypothetical protein
VLAVISIESEVRGYPCKPEAILNHAVDKTVRKTLLNTDMLDLPYVLFVGVLLRKGREVGDKQQAAAQQVKFEKMSPSELWRYHAGVK